jgi:hypothetical protein
MIQISFQLHGEAIPENFLRDDITVNGRRHLVFATDTQASILRRASRWYVDGTFKVCYTFCVVTFIYECQEK